MCSLHSVDIEVVIAFRHNVRRPGQIVVTSKLISPLASRRDVESKTRLQGNLDQDKNVLLCSRLCLHMTAPLSSSSNSSSIILIVVVLSVTVLVWASSSSAAAAAASSSSSAANNENDDTTNSDSPTTKTKTNRMKESLFDVQDLIAPRTFEVHDPMSSNNEDYYNVNIHPDARGAFDGRRPNIFNT